MGEEFRTPGGTKRWAAFGSVEPIVLVHGTPYSSFLWREIAPALAQRRKVFVFDHLGFGQSDQREDQVLSLAAQAKNFTELLDHWGSRAPASSPATSEARPYSEPTCSKARTMATSPSSTPSEGCVGAGAGVAAA